MDKKVSMRLPKGLSKKDRNILIGKMTKRRRSELERIYHEPTGVVAVPLDMVAEFKEIFGKAKKQKSAPL